MTQESRRAVRAALPALAACVLLGTIAGMPAYADDQPKKDAAESHQEALDTEIDPLAEDNFITDDMEAGVTALPSGVTCTAESAQTAPNPVPTSPTFVLLYVYPYDTTPASHLDLPRSCSNGGVIASSIAKSSRNLATFQYEQNAGLQVRTANLTYVHNFTGSSYSTRGVRRFKSPTSAASWRAIKTWDTATGSSPKLARLANELDAKGFNIASTRYSAVLDSSDTARCTATACKRYAGVADTPGPYGFSLRSYIQDGVTYYVRFGCATGGDTTFGHETTHQTGAEHTTDYAYDLMSRSGAGGSRNYRNGAVWDYGRNSYHSTVYNSVYVGKTGLAGNYFTCT